ncbi:MAG: hypothetical protein A2W25_13290 [candidate division Zixibacteria bacterium RBG_16_53_22]|nr:MAG: hypothetical protein A2W25_13290 [candidate division Zixibacteria bacterium RBG_16_53_22]
MRPHLNLSGKHKKPGNNAGLEIPLKANIWLTVFALIRGLFFAAALFSSVVFSIPAWEIFAILLEFQIIVKYYF